MGGEEGDMNRARRYRVILPLAVAVGVVAFACWPRGPRLEWWTSRKISGGGSGFQVQVLLPTGWQVQRDEIIPNPAGADLWVVVFRPPRPFRWLPVRMRRALSLDPHPDNWLDLAVEVTDRNMIGDGRQEVTAYTDGPVKSYMVTRGSGRVDPALVYSRTRQEEFEATYRQICQSFRVLK